MRISALKAKRKNKMSEEISTKEVELKEVRAMVYIPENSVEVTISAKVYKDGKLIEVEKVIDMQEVQKAVRDAEENYIGEDDMFQVTEKGLRWLKEIENDGHNDL